MIYRRRIDNREEFVAEMGDGFLRSAVISDRDLGFGYSEVRDSIPENTIDKVRGLCTQLLAECERDMAVIFNSYYGDEERDVSFVMVGFAHDMGQEFGDLMFEPSSYVPVQTPGVKEARARIEEVGRRLLPGRLQFNVVQSVDVGAWWKDL
jgi:hypothetical protein